MILFRIYVKIVLYIEFYERWDDAVKKALSLLLVMAMLMNMFALCVFAAEASTTAPYQTEYDIETSDAIGEISFCRYNAARSTVTISGTINHDIMVKYSGYKIALYRVPVGKTLEDIILAPDAKPLSSADISVKFEFTVKAETDHERFAGYAVLIYKDKEFKIIGEPRYPGVDASYSYTLGDKSYYKGISSELISNAVDTGAGIAVIPVYFEKLLSTTTTGYIYSLQGSYIYFDKNYITELDKTIKSYCAVGTKVYLQFLISDGTNTGVHTLKTSLSEYLIPDMSAEQTISLVSSFTDFLCDRYSNNSRGKISGIILGRAVDRAYCGDDVMSVADYSFNYARYMLAVSCVARSFIPELDMVMPLSDKSPYIVSSTAEEGYSSSKMLETMCGFFDEYFAGKFVFSTMVESSAIPYGISDEALKNKEFSDGGYGGINADHTKVFSQYLDKLEVKYDSAPQSFIFNWSVPEEISGNVLSCAYSYSYFKLLSNDRVSAFVVSFTDNERKGNYGYLDEIARIMKYIDTADGFSITAPQLKLFGASSWYAVVTDMYSGRFDTKRIIPLGALSEMPSAVIGNYMYYDFTYYTDISSWFGGNFCDSLKITYNDISGRSLEAHFTEAQRAPTEYSEIYCAYEYPENYVFTPFISLKFSIQNDNNVESELYEFKLTVGSDKNVSEIKRVCSAYEQIELMFDISKFCEVSMAEYVKISVRSLGNDGGGYSLYLSSMNGFSDKYISSELDTLISEERLKIRDMQEKDESSENNAINTVMIVAGVAIVIAVIGVGIFMCFRKEDAEE